MSIDSNLWESIKYVSSGITLIAFIVAAIAWTYRDKINERERILRSLPESDRASALPEVFAWLKIDPKGLTKNQQYELALMQIRERTKQHYISTIAITFVFVIGAITTIYAISQPGRSQPPQIQDPNNISPTDASSNNPQAIDGPDVPVVSKDSCSDGKSIRLYRYYGAKKSGHDEVFDQLQGILENKIIALSERYSGLGHDYQDISTLHICVLHSSIKSSQHVADIFASDKNSIELSTGTIFYDSTIPIAHSNIYILYPDGPKSLNVKNSISATEFSNLRDEFTIITLLALAVDAKRNNLPRNVIVKYLGEAHLLVSNSPNDKLKALIAKELESYRIAPTKVSG